MDTFSEPCDYIKNKKIGSKGAYGDIFDVSPKSDESKHYAYKMIRYPTDKLHANLVEIDITFSFDSKYIVKGIEAIGYGTCDTKLSGIVMELGLGNLYELVEKGSSFTYNMRLYAAYCIIKGVLCLHQHNYLHLDIKMENILFFMEGGRLVFKLADFGLSSYGRSILTKQLRITSWYRPIEVFDRPDRYDQSSDIFSIGMLMIGLFRMKTGSDVLPFRATDDAKIRTEMYHFIKDAKLSSWISPDIPAGQRDKLIDLMASMVDLNPNRRPTAEQILSNEIWTSVAEPPTRSELRLDDGYIGLEHFSPAIHEKLKNILNTIFSFFAKFPVGFIFLVIDIYLRIIASCGNKLTDHDLRIISFCTLNIGIKFYKWEATFVIPDELIKEVEKMEVLVLRILGNKINQDKFYIQARCLEDLIFLYKNVVLSYENCRHYLLINPRKFFGQNSEGPTSKEHEVSVFSRLV